MVCKNDLTKRKFLWFFFDGLAFDEIHHLYEKKRNKAAFYRVTTDFFRQSGALHEIFLTGKFSRNFLALPTKNDNLLYQLKQSNNPLKYIGSEYPLYYLGGGDTKENYFENRTLARDNFPLSIVCPAISESLFYPVSFKYNIPADFDKLDFNKKKLMSYLDGKYSSNLQKSKINSCFKLANLLSEENPKNLIYYTQIIDAFNHGYSKEHPRTFAASYAINKAILEIMEWINDNPDYVLLVLSDHGGQAYLGEDNYCNHGCLNPGNEGVLVVYMKNFDEIRPMEEEAPIINTFDVADIVSQVIENVNMPLESNGKIIKITKNSK